MISILRPTTISWNSLLSAWKMLEINLLSFIPIICNNKKSHICLQGLDNLSLNMSSSPSQEKSTMLVQFLIDQLFLSMKYVNIEGNQWINEKLKWYEGKWEPGNKLVKLNFGKRTLDTTPLTPRLTRGSICSS